MIHLVVFAEDSFVSGPLASFVRVDRFRVVACSRPGPETYNKRGTSSGGALLLRGDELKCGKINKQKKKLHIPFDLCIHPDVHSCTFH